MTIRPRRISAIASSIVESGMGLYSTILTFSVNSLTWPVRALRPHKNKSQTPAIKQR
jgi:hypothetical protein